MLTLIDTDTFTPQRDSCNNSCNKQCARCYQRLADQQHKALVKGLLSPSTKLLISAVMITQMPKQLATKTSSTQAGVGKPAYPRNSTKARIPDLVTPASAPSCNARAVSGLPFTWAAVATAAGPAAALAAMSSAARAKNTHTMILTVSKDKEIYAVDEDWD